MLERFPKGSPAFAFVEADSCRVVSEHMQDHLSVAETCQPARGRAKKSPSQPVALRFRRDGQKTQHCCVRWISRCPGAWSSHQGETVEMSCGADHLPQHSTIELGSRPFCHAGCHSPVAGSAGADPQLHALVYIVFDSVADRVNSVADKVNSVADKVNIVADRKIAHYAPSLTGPNSIQFAPSRPGGTTG